MFGTFSLLILTTITSALLVGGLLALLLGNLTQVVRDQLQLSSRGEISLKAAFFVAFIGLLFLGGLLTDLWGLKGTLITGSTLAAFSIASLGMSRNFRGTLFFTILLGMATGLLHTATTVAMPWAFFPDFPEEAIKNYTPAATNLGYIFIVLGGLILPALAAFLVDRLSFRHGLLLLALLALVPALIAAFPGSVPSSPTRTINLAELFGDIRFWLALAAVFCFYALESSALRWTPKYLEEIGIINRSKLALLVGFWIVFLGSRLVCASLGSLVGFSWVVVILALLAAVVIGNMIGMYQAGPGTTSFLILAACLGPVFPTLAGLILAFFPSQPATAFGLLCAAGNCGRLLSVTWTDHLLADGKVRHAMGLSMILGLIVFLPPLVWVILL